jgi:glycosyltransferase involved in cell wall biosynthesis
VWLLYSKTSVSAARHVELQSCQALSETHRIAQRDSLFANMLNPSLDKQDLTAMRLRDKLEASRLPAKLNRLCVTQVLASVDDPGAGPSYSATRLASALAEEGVDVTIRSVAGWRGCPLKGGEIGGEEQPRVVRSPLNRGPLARRICSSDDLRRALQVDACRADVLHTHGLWLMPNVYPAWAARRAGSRAALILSPRGMLGDGALAFSRGKKRLFWTLFQKQAVSAASVLHATSEAELSDIREFGLKTPVAVIPNGVDLPEKAEQKHNRAREVLYLGRVHPKKGIDVLIRAWALVAKHRPDWRLRIVGPVEGDHGEELKRLAADLCAPRISIEGPAFGASRLAAYRNASLFVLPTRHENFAMVVAEALAAELPVIASRGAPWAGLELEGCGWWVNHGVEAFATAIEGATGEGAARLAAMGARGRAWMARDFSWPRVARDMLALYRWLQQGGTPPKTVRVD